MNRIKIVLSSLFGTLAMLPTLAFAQAAGGNVVLRDLGTALTGVKGLMNMVVPILIGLAIIVFLWGVLNFILHAGDEAKREDGKKFMIYGLIGIVVMVSVWGLVAFIQGTFGIQQASQVVIPGPQLPQ